MQTQKRFVCTEPVEDPFLNRDFIPNVGTTAPQVFCGGQEGYARQVQLNTELREQMTRDPRSCNNFLLRDGGNMQYLPCEWQQPDYRPHTFTVWPRQMVKNTCRTPEAAPRPHGHGLPGFVYKNV